MENLEALRKKIYDRWDLVRSFRGEWNDGYSEGLRWAMSLIYDEIRKQELQKPKVINIDKNEKEWYYKQPFKKDEKQ